MVQRPSLRRDYLPRESGWSERSFVDLSSDARFSVPHPVQQSLHPRCLPVETALKACAGLSVKEFALIVFDENGEEKTYTSTSLTPYQRQIFSDRFKGDFRRNVQRASQGAHPQSAYSQDGSLYSDFDTEGDLRTKQTGSESSSEGRRYHRQSRSEETDDDSTNERSSRKRVRSQYTDDATIPAPVPVAKTQQLIIGDEAEVDKFYNIRFKDMQQFSCKIMGKAFVKLVEPKKQTHHPYTKGAAKAPPWWPPTSGDNLVQHKEPDHLLKAERVRLLIHIVKMITAAPENQCANVRKEQLSVRKLEEVTMEAMSNFFNDKDRPENAQKKVYLKEIFKVARAQERFNLGEIDASTRVPVQFGDRNVQENSEDDDQDGEGVKDEDQEEEPVSTALPLSSSDPISPPMLQTQNMQQEDPDFFRDRPLPVRYNSQIQASMENNHSYGDPYLQRTMTGFQQQVSPTAQDPRRTFPSPGYQTQNMYSWHSSMVPSPAQSQFYVTSPSSNIPQQPVSYQLPQLPPQLPPVNMLGHHQHPFSDGLPPARYDSGPALGNQLRTGSLGHPHQLSHGFQEYLADPAYGHNEGDLKNDSHIHGS